MSLRRKRKVSAPARLASPFVDDVETVTSSSRRTVYDDDDYRRQHSSSHHRNLFLRKTNTTASSFEFERNATIAEELQSPNIDVFIDDVDANHLHHQHQRWGDADEDEGYNSPHPSPRKSLLSPSNQPQLEFPENPGELTLHYLVCSFLVESDKKIDAFARSVSSE